MEENNPIPTVEQSNDETMVDVVGVVDDAVVVVEDVEAQKKRDRKGKAIKIEDDDDDGEGSQRRSEVWKHFSKKFFDVDGIQKTKCNYCEKKLRAHSSKNGTSSLKNHVSTCKKNPEALKNQKLLGLSRYFISDDVNVEYGSSLATWKFDSRAVKKALADMIIIDELPFSIVEKIGFKRFVTVALPPSFKLPSRRTITKSCYDTYVEERIKLKKFFQESKQRVSLTTDTWTSTQRISYMSLTAHFIDDGWKLHKKVINFCPVDSHRGEELGDLVQTCLRDWGLERVYALTVDNASSNDGVVRVVKEALNRWGTAVLGGEHLHMRCAAHIINLVVQDGAKMLNSSIASVRAAVKYIRQSPQRIRRFKEAAIVEQIDSNKTLKADEPTRWNSLYVMLETAVKYEMAFERYSRLDPAIRAELSSGTNAPGFPSCIDWVNIRRLVRFLEHFFYLTEKVSGTLYTTSNLYFPEICEVDSILQEWEKDADLSTMAKKMRQKYEKYWGDPLKMNKNIFIAVVLDPRHKLGFVQFLLVRMFGPSKGKAYGDMVRRECEKLFDEYKRLNSSGITIDRGQSYTQQSAEIVGSSGLEEHESSKRRRTMLRSEYAKYKEGIDGNAEKTELEKYLNDDTEPFSDDFDILLWWKVHSPRFPVVSAMARDVLAVPISTVASEAAFSTSGRVLDAFRSSLTPRMAQALICTEDWLKSKGKQASDLESEEQLRDLEQEMEQMHLDATIIQD